MKLNSIIYLFILFLLPVFLSCNKEDKSITDTDFTTKEIISPTGKWMATSENSLLKLIEPTVFQLLNSDAKFEIITYDFLETDFETAIVIDIENNQDKSGRVFFVKEFASSLLRADDKCYTFYCNGDCNCSGSGTIFQGTITYVCEGDDCSCSLTIREADCK